MYTLDKNHIIYKKRCIKEYNRYIRNKIRKKTKETTAITTT